MRAPELYLPNLRLRRRSALLSAARLAGWLMLAVLALGCRARASNPRWITGPPYFTNAGTPVNWYTRTPLYSTDPGDLSSYVNHAAADSLVAAAADVWNVPSADFIIAQGGQLAEHVSGENSYMGGSGVVFPADVQASNYSNVPIAVIYDSDGSVTDLLLGQGASAPLECGQYGVTESVDQISTAGKIQHAVIVLNGRCTGPAPEQQLQLQYQLMRAFGRVFGVGWSQTNDNVFTHTPEPTYDQAMHWPIMHPIDIVCGLYTYQCQPNPFTLRDDDVAGISQLYVIGFTQEFGWGGYDQWLPGKNQTYDRAADLYGSINFPNGQGMEGVNVLVQRLYMFNPTPEAFYDTSSVSGFRYQRNAGNPVTGPTSDMEDSIGSPDLGMEGWFDVGWIPMIANSEYWVDVLVSTEPINPLYIGAHSVGPYVTGTVTPSGTTAPLLVNGLYPNDPGFEAIYVGITANNATSACNSGGDGTELAPEPTDPTGWWNDALCGPGHTAWSSLQVASGHTATIEVTALDESGGPTGNKLRPLIGIWNASDPTGTPPTYANTSAALNGMAFGMTPLSIAGTASGALRMAITDDRGDGRPDYAYKARVLYAASVLPAVTSLNGGPLTITGTGFRAGNQVLVNGVPAIVSGWTSNTITATAPPANQFASVPAGAVDIAVNDLQTGGSTTMSGALTYTAQPGDVLALVSAPSGTVPVGEPAPAAFAVRVLLPDGVTPVPGVGVLFTSSGSSVQLSGCSGTPCMSITNAAGLASVSVTPQSSGTVSLTAAAVGAVQTIGFYAQSRLVSAPNSTVYVAAGATVPWNPVAALLQDGSPAADVPVQWSGSTGLGFTQLNATSGANGLAQGTSTIGPLSAGAAAAGQVCGWTIPGVAPACTSLVAVGVDPAVLRPVIVSGAGQAIALSGSFAPLTLQVADPAGHPVGGGTVTIHQTVDQAQMPCPARGACPAAAQLASSLSSAVSAIDGTVTIAPLNVPNTASVTHIAVSSGAQGFVSLSLTHGQ